MTSFFEPAYWGKNKGEVIEFSDPEEPVLFVAGMLVKPRKPVSDQLNGVTLLTHTASEQMLEYHHRQIVTFKPKSAIEYLNLGNVSAEERFNFILKNRYFPKFETSSDRHMAKGWERRVSDHEEALESEMQYRKTLDKEEALG